MLKRLLILAAIALLATGAVAQVKDFADNVDHSNCFQVPDPGPLGTSQTVEQFEGGIPGSWTVECDGTQQTCWSVTGQDSCALMGNLTNGSGLAACANADFSGSSVIVDTSMITECYDYTGASSSSLFFTANYRDLSSGQDLFEVDYSTDGGANWTNLLSWDANHGSPNGTPGEDVTLETSALDGVAGAQFRYHYYDDDGPGWDWYVQVDDVELLADGVITDGGDCTGDDDGGDGVPAATTIGIAVLVLLMGGAGAYFLRRR